MTDAQNPIAKVDDKSIGNLPATAAEQATAMLQMIKEVALTPGANIAAIEAMLNAQERLENRQAERAFNEALSRIAAKLPRVKRSGKVEYAVNKNDPKGPKEEAFKFARYEDIDKAIRPLLVEEGFSISFTTEPRVGEGGGLNMIGTLSHVQGHRRTASIAVALDSSGGKNNIQGMGSSSSYGKRYVTCMLLNIITEGEDDDGTSAEPITVEQAAEIDLKIVEVGADKKKFLDYLRTDSVLNIRARDYKKAMAALDKKAEENKAKTKKAG